MDAPKHSSALFLRDTAIRRGMELMMFAQTRFLRTADEKLAELGLGRAHHRALYFIGRCPDVTVGDLLLLLAVTKQSLGRVMKDLVDRDLVCMRAGDVDRRQRLLRLTEQGVALETALFEEQRDRMAKAYSYAGQEAVAGYWAVMEALIPAEARAQIDALGR
ncbi:MarR family winged helix-turn-helix transcriptional regulator [Sphingomonas aquatilis]|jgi:DNA-binding MarR family transcriptional regulator|uniref:DNA-binding MarR family transcriptional regulator n=1 Tax=Sphingomonas aquatilis TaxID=93063 RepID=A0AAW3TRM4_9SPHN|nr:MarR family winged helix-turn-helix transcriptional regulator [Sphingomonas aquatilis]MCI1141719.1 MarR family winged helix-turn-helix transcriptional regulator [Sphingomonas sp. WKB10]MBB3875222.1 DNA-binding MarR family transcriptional regulator [Sphingomonas aquatilis]MCI4653356.1 MarR family winged helix-turn-helix transcriptional regulator [Sphingomonas aquatilis]GEM72382.1 MarR family transcriptional regulator [Sphingomonas aquatilis NBRC 16722]GKS02918.1 MarR family transcriptional r